MRLIFIILACSLVGCDGFKYDMDMDLEVNERSVQLPNAAAEGAKAALNAGK